LLNQSLRPWTTPQRKDDFISLHAAAREALTIGAAPLLTRDGADEADLVLLAGAPIARGSKPSAMMLMALDALQLRGIFSIAGDVTGIAAGLGAVAAINPDAAAQVVESDALVTWGTAFVPTISSRAGEGVALQLRVLQAHGGQFQAEVKTGSLELIPLPLDEKAQIEVRPARGVDLGVPLKGGVFKREVQGGAVGLIIDARGRPVPRLDNLERQRERVQEWMWEVGA
jgi:hypothetical protein